MVSRAMRHTLATLGGRVALAAIPGTGLPQSPSDGLRADDRQRIAEEINAARAKGGPIAEVFVPPMPIVLRTFLPNPLATPATDRYLDVAFEITKYGESRRVEIRGPADDPDAARDELVHVMNAGRFRPRAVDGEHGRASPVVVHYYVND